MGLFNRKMKFIIVVGAALASSLFVYNNCSKRTFSTDTITQQRQLSVGALILINDDADYTNSDQVSLYIEHNSAKEMYVTNTADCSSGGVWETYAQNKPWSLGNKNTRTKVYAKFREEVGGVESLCTWDSIIHDDVPPQITLVTAAPAMTNSPNISLQFSGYDALSGIKGYTCKNGAGASLSNCKELLVMSGVSEGPGSVRIVAEDNAGNFSQPLNQSWLADFTAPKVFLNSTPPLVSNQMAAQFGFSANDNFSSIIKLECKMDGGPFTVCTSPAVYNLSEGSHTFQVRATDNTGNVSSPVSYSWTIDLSAPTVTITSHPNSFSNSASAIFMFTGMDDGKTITKFDCKMDNGSFNLCTSPMTYGSLGDGSHTFSVRGYDAAGNLSQPTSYKWIIDTVKPVVALTAQPAKETSDIKALFQFIATDAGSGVQYTECKLDGGNYVKCNNTANYDNLATGNHSFFVRAVDLAGNTSNVIQYDWNIDNQAPTIKFIQTPLNPTNIKQAIFEVLGTDNSPKPLSYECRLDGELMFVPCSARNIYNLITEGVHNFSARCYDAAKNYSPTISYSWLLDFNGPAINFTNIPAMVVSILDNVKVGFEVADAYSAITSVKCGPDLAPVNCTPVFNETFANLGAGAYKYTVTAQDALGNTSKNSIEWSVVNNIKAMTQTVTVSQNNKADFLIIIDNSGSMKTEQANMAARFSSLIDKLAGLDWRLAIVTTDVSSNADKKDGRFLQFSGLTGQYYIHSGMPIETAKTAFANTIQRPAGEGSGAEQGIAATFRALQRTQDPVSVNVSAPNRDFFRPDAVLSMLVVTDANETNTNGTQPQNVPQNLVNYIKGLWPSKSFVYSSIIVRSGDTACRNAGGNEGYGVTYEQMSQLTGGEIGTVCATDYSNQLQRIGQKVVDLVKVVNLNCTPVDQNKNGQLIDDIMVTLEGGSMISGQSISGQVLTLANPLPVGTHSIKYWCLQ